MSTRNTIEFRPVSAGMDLDLVHGWMRQPHVTRWSDRGGERDDTRDYLFARLRLKHRDCWIVSDGGVPAAYAETFVVLHDRLRGRRRERAPADVLPHARRCARRDAR